MDGEEKRQNGMKESLRRISELVQRDRSRERRQMALEAEEKSKLEAAQRPAQKRTQNKFLSSPRASNIFFMQQRPPPEAVAPRPDLDIQRLVPSLPPHTVRAKEPAPAFMMPAIAYPPTAVAQQPQKSQKRHIHLLVKTLNSPENTCSWNK